MPDLNAIDDTKKLLIVLILLALAALGWPFNMYINRAAELDPHNSDASMYTVIGTAYTLVGALLIIAILYDWMTALITTGIVFVCFGASGTPMIFGDMNRGRKRRMKAMSQAPAVQPLPDYYPENVE